MVGSFYDPDLDEGCAFEELISFHGGLGGLADAPVHPAPRAVCPYPTSRSSARPRSTACWRLARDAPGRTGAGRGVAPPHAVLAAGLSTRDAAGAEPRRRDRLHDRREPVRAGRRSRGAGIRRPDRARLHLLRRRPVLQHGRVRVRAAGDQPARAARTGAGGRGSPGGSSGSAQRCCSPARSCSA